MKTKGYLLLTMLCLAAQILCADGLHIVFSESANNIIGVTPKMRNVDDMFYFSMEQAAVFAAKLDKSFCIFRTATLDRLHGETDDIGTATFIVNVVADWELLLDYLDFIECIDSFDFHGFTIGIWDVYDDIPSVYTSPLTDTIEEINPELVLDGNSVIAQATARSVHLDIALDEAFKLALSEISKYQDMNIQNMTRGIEDFTELVVLINAENVVSEVKLAEVKMFYDTTATPSAYIAKMTLKKEY